MTRKDKTSRLEKLRKHWHRASEEERLRFITELELNIDLGNADRDRAKTAAAPIANGRYLLPQAVKRIEAVMIRRSIGPVQAAAEIGFPSETLALTRALAQGRSLRLAIISALTLWLDENEARIK